MLTKRFFNTAGPVDSKRHYCLPPLERFDLAKIERFIDQQKYFVLHAPRQTGKTTSLLSLMEHLNSKGVFKCLYCNVEGAQAARENVKKGMTAILNEIASRADLYLGDPFLKTNWRKILDDSGEHGALNESLTLWARNSKKPLVLFVDEIDALVGDTLISVLRQIRAGYDKRPGLFPQSVSLCGVWDVRDYRIHSASEKTVITGGSAFNIKAASLRLGDFSLDETSALLEQHTEDTGQQWEPGTIEKTWELSGGQPWLTNALAYETCFEMEDENRQELPISPGMIEQAKDKLIKRRETHLDQLVDKLQEERVRRVIEPILSGEQSRQLKPDDLEYVRDLGLIRVQSNGGIEIANPIYREIIHRELTWAELERENFSTNRDLFYQ